MGKRLPYLALAVLLAFSTCVLMGGKVRAASPIFFDGTVQWLIGRRNTIDQEDFNYTYKEFSVPMFGSIPRIYEELGGIPSNKSTQTTFTKIPATVAVQCPDVITEGGYVYISFVIGYPIRYSTVGSGNWSFNISGAKAYRYSQGSLSYLPDYAQPLTYESYSHGGNITEFSVIPEYDLMDYRYWVDNQYITNGAYNGSNFAKHVFYMDGTQFATDTGMTELYIYQDTSLNWYKSAFFTYKITVPAYQPNNRQMNTVYLVLDNVLQGNFISRNASITVHDTLTGSNDQYTVPAADLVYLCPVYCYATSSGNYLEVEEYLKQINSNLSSILGGQSVSQSVLESYAAMGSEAREAAEEAVRAMSVAQPTFNESDYDVFSNIDSVAMQQFSGVLSFLSLRRILPILLAALALVTIGYLFFGKK